MNFLNMNFQILCSIFFTFLAAMSMAANLPDQVYAMTKDLKLDVSKRSDQDSVDVSSNEIEDDKRASGVFDASQLVNVKSKTITTGNDDLALSDLPGSALDPADYHRARESTEFDSPAMDDDPILKAGGWEGDIDNVATDNLLAILSPAGQQRNAIKETSMLWPNGVVPYVISSSYSSQERTVIAKAMNEYHTKTCIRFIPRTNEYAYIHIVPGNGCSSSVGRTGRMQSVSLGNGCVYLGIVIHELMHAVGFWHEQSRADRDENVEILWNNIMSDMSYNFMKYNLNQINHLGAPYDTCSVMHYGAYAFSKNRNPTIRSLQAGKCELGQRSGFSDNDLMKINKLYSCKSTTTETVTPKPTPTKPVGVCNDTHIHCATWAKEGECQKNPSWMLKGCPLSCNECKNDCNDLNMYCKQWADSGECSKNPDYMSIYCQRSCQICDSSANCQDENKFCDQWAQNGHCTSPQYENYMLLRCKKACKKC